MTRLTVLLHKLMKNTAVSLGLVLPNLVISLGAQSYFVGYLHWNGWLGILSWVIGAGGGFSFGVLFATFTKSNFRLGKRVYSYAVDERDQ